MLIYRLYGEYVERPKVYINIGYVVMFCWCDSYKDRKVKLYCSWQTSYGERIAPCCSPNMFYDSHDSCHSVDPDRQNIPIDKATYWNALY